MLRRTTIVGCVLSLVLASAGVASATSTVHLLHYVVPLPGRTRRPTRWQ